jgi:hypothetical protein
MPRANDTRDATSPVKVLPVVVWLTALVVALAVVAAGVGLFWRTGDGPVAFTTLRGQAVQLDGHGLYRNDTVFAAAGNRGTDAVTLALGIPLLVVAAARYRRGSLRGALLLAGAFTYFLYVYATMALNAAYGDFFLVYVALFSASCFGLALTCASVNLDTLPDYLSPERPRRGPAAFMFAGGVVTLVVWIGPLLTALIARQPPKLLDSYSTMVTYALDLALITPLCFVAAVLFLRRAPLAYLVAFPLLGIVVLLAPAIVAQTVSQVAAGVTFTPPEAVGPIGGFALLGGFAIRVGVVLLRSIAEAMPGAKLAPGRGVSVAVSQ